MTLFSKPLCFILLTLLLRQFCYPTLLSAQPNPVPNVASIDGGTFKYMSRTEVSNLDYREFLAYLQRHDSPAAYRAALPDTTSRLSSNGEEERWVHNYLTHAVFNDYPVVNLSHAQARAYCAWLTDRLNEKLRSEAGRVKAVIVRLPTAEEWETAAYGSQPYGQRAWYPWGHNQLRHQEKGKNEGKLLANYRRGKGEYRGLVGSKQNASSFLDPTRSGVSTGNGFIHLAGNVAEMLR